MNRYGCISCIHDNVCKIRKEQTELRIEYMEAGWRFSCGYYLPKTILCRYIEGGGLGETLEGARNELERIEAEERRG